MTSADLLNEWQDLNDKEVEKCILEAEEKVACKRPHNDSEEFIATMGRKALAHRRSTATTPPCIIFTDAPEILSIDQYINLDRIQCKTFDPINGSMVEFPLLHWATQRYYKIYTLVIIGEAGLGKSPAALSLMQSIAEEIFTESTQRTYFAYVKTIEGLREAVSGNFLRAGVGIIFDDIEPSKVRGTRGGSTVEDMKALCEVTTSTCIHARYRGIVLAENEPRIFTANGREPCHWHDGLPRDVWATSNEVRANYDMNITAVFKRTCFAFLDAPLIPESLRTEFAVKRRRAN